MGLLLAIDVGNTNIVMGAYDEDRLVASWRVATDSHRMPDEWIVVLHDLLAIKGLEITQLSGVALSSVVPSLTVSLREMTERHLKIDLLVVEPGIKTGLRILYDNPREVGADRIVNSIAAFHKYGGPAIVIDFGTATTFDVLSDQGEYLGGAIAPGIVISTEALYRYAAKLPSVELVKPRSAIGKNTIASMQAGIILGYISLVEGLVARLKSEIGVPTTVIATGGLVDPIANGTSVIDHVDPDLTLEGLRLIYRLNRHDVNVA